MESIAVQIPSELFAPAQNAHFTGAMSLPALKAGFDLYEFNEPLSWQVDITNVGDAFLVQGTVEGEAKTACARCLEDVSFPITGEIEGYYLIADDAHIPDECEEDEFEILPANHIIDLAPLINASLLLEMPLVPLCQDDCRGLCPTCGANLNKGPCACSEVAPAEANGDNPFSILKDYDFGN